MGCDHLHEQAELGGAVGVLELEDEIDGADEDGRVLVDARLDQIVVARERLGLVRLDELQAARLELVRVVAHRRARVVLARVAKAAVERLLFVVTNVKIMLRNEFCSLDLTEKVVDLQRSCS